MLCNICRTSPVEPKTFFKIMKIRKTTSMENKLTGKCLKKLESWDQNNFQNYENYEDDLHERRPPWKTTSLEDDLNSFDANSASITSTAEPELGTAQPQHVSTCLFTLPAWNDWVEAIFGDIDITFWVGIAVKSWQKM